MSSRLPAGARGCCPGRVHIGHLVVRERGLTHVTIYRWVQRFTLLLIDAARPCRHASGDRWFVDETYVKVAGQWRYVYRAIDQYGQVIDVLVSEKRDMVATRRFFTRALEHGPSPTEVTTDKAAVYPPVLEEVAPGAWHHTEPYANNRIEADHSQLKRRLRPMRGLKRLRCARVISRATPSCKTSAADPTNSGPRKEQTSGSWLPSTS